MKVLICGAGVSGLTLAWCLEQRGHEVMIIERRAQMPSDDYMIDFCDPAYDAAERLGLLSRLQPIHQPIDRLIIVNGDGSERMALPYRAATLPFGGGG